MFGFKEFVWSLELNIKEDAMQLNTVSHNIKYMDHDLFYFSEL